MAHRSATPPQKLRIRAQSSMEREAAKFPTRTVSVAWLSQFVEHNREKLTTPPAAPPPDWGTTSWVSETLLKPHTKQERCCYVDLVGGALTSDGHPAVGEAKFFVSHAWGYRFLDMAEAIIEWGRTATAPAYVWLDIVSVNQHGEPQPPAWWDSTFRSAVGDLGHTLLVLAPWDKPLALTRVWCLWEILCTVDTGAELSVVLTAQERQRLTEELARDLDNVMTTVANVDAAKADAFLEDDKERIFAAIERVLPKGFDQLNEKVKDRLKQWIFESGMRALRAMSPEEQIDSKLITSLAEYCRKDSRYDEGAELYQKAIEGRRGKYGEEHPRTLDTLAGLGYLLEYRGDNEGARPILTQALTGRRKLVAAADASDESKQKCYQSMNDLGNLFLNAKDFAQAEELYNEALAGRKQLLEPLHYDVLQSLNNLGRLYTKMNRMQEAQDMFRAATTGRMEKEPDHPSTLYGMKSLAEFLRDKVGTAVACEEANGLLSQALQKQRRRLGFGHADTLSTAVALSTTLLKKHQQGSDGDPLHEALQLAEEAYDGFVKLHKGEETHDDTLKADKLRRQVQAAQAAVDTTGSSKHSHDTASEVVWTTTTKIYHPNGSTIVSTTTGTSTGSKSK